METYSIFRFFKRNDPCSSSERQEMTENADVNAPSSSHTEVPKEGFLEAVGTNNCSSRSLQSDQSKAAWSYKIDDIDPSVIDELPHEVQEEVRAWLRPHKRQNAVRKGSSIANYFLPTKKT